MKKARRISWIIAATTTSLFALSALADGSNNTINFDLTGDNLKPSVKQDGNYNAANMTLKNTPGEMLIDQKGNKNAASINMQNSTGKVTIQQVGEKNTANVRPYEVRTHMGDTSVQQQGKNNVLDASLTTVDAANSGAGATFIQKGDDNQLVILGAGIYYKGQGQYVGRTYNQTGNGNIAILNKSPIDGLTQIGNGNYTKIDGEVKSSKQQGSGNRIDTRVSGNGTYHPINFEQAGNSNVISGTHNGVDINGDTKITQTGDRNKSTGDTTGTGIVIQQGNDNTNATNLKHITLKQVGTLNSIKGDLSGYFTPLSTVTQEGSGNSATVSGKLTDALIGSQVKFSTLKQKGSTNTLNYTVKDTGNFATISQDGKKNEATLTADTGSTKNVLSITQTGEVNKATQYVKGNNNELAILQTGNMNVASQSFVGNGNKSSIIQTGNSHSAKLDITGNSNNLNVTQSGVGQTFSLTRVGNGLSMNIVQK